MTLLRAMLPRRIMTILFLPAGMGALYGDREAAPRGEGAAEAGAAPDRGLALALWLPLREVEASAAASRVALAELSPRLLTLSPESTRAFLHPHGMPHVLLGVGVWVAAGAAATERGCSLPGLW